MKRLIYKLFFLFQSFSLGLQLVMIRMKRNIGCLVHGLER